MYFKVMWCLNVSFVRSDSDCYLVSVRLFIHEQCIKLYNLTSQSIAILIGFINN